MTIVIHETNVFTGDEDGAFLEDAAVAIAGGRIADLGPSADIVARFAGAELVSGKGKLVASGFANCQTHLQRIYGRGIMDDQNAPNRPPYSRAGYLRMPSLTSREREVMIRLATLEAIRSGTTLLMEIGPNLASYADLMGQAGLRCVLAEQVSDRPAGSVVGEPTLLAFDASRIDENIKRIETLHDHRHGSFEQRVTVAAAAHAPDMVSPELFRRLRALQERLDIVATVHLNQYWGEVRAIEETFGVPPTQHLSQLGFLNKRVVAAHCRCMTPHEEDLLGASGASVCFTPGVSARCGNSCRAGVLEAAGARIVLGSDEFTEDMVEAMRLGLLLERVRRGESTSPMPQDAWRWATHNGYVALGVEDGGLIKPGFRADLIMIDCLKPHLVPNVTAISGFVHHGRAGDISDVMVDGNWLMRDGLVLVFDEASLLAEAERIGKSAWSHAITAAAPGTRIPAGLLAVR
jgi:5-methylthioadenosine/S-adenosylhomocysteine deaminase